MKYLYLNDNFKLYTVEDLQKILKISRSFAYKLVNSGELKCVRMHKLIRISPWALEEYMNFSRGKPCTDGWRRNLFLRFRTVLYHSGIADNFTDWRLLYPPITEQRRIKRQTHLSRNTNCL